MALSISPVAILAPSESAAWSEVPLPPPPPPPPPPPAGRSDRPAPYDHARDVDQTDLHEATGDGGRDDAVRGDPGRDRTIVIDPTKLQ